MTKDESPTEQPTEEKQGRFLSRSLLFFLALLGVAIYFAPDIVCNSKLKYDVVRYLFPDLNGDVQLEKVAIHWNSPLVVDGLTINHPAGETVVTASQVTGNKTLWQIITRPTQLGTITIREAHINAEIDAAGELNLMPVFGDMLTAEPTVPRKAVFVAIENSTIDFHDARLGKRIEIPNFAAEYEQQSQNEDIAFTTNGDVKMDRHEGQFKASGFIKSDGTMLNLDISQVPAALLSPLIAANEIPCSVMGLINSSVRIEITNPGDDQIVPTTSLAGELTIDDLVLVMSVDDTTTYEFFTDELKADLSLPELIDPTKPKVNLIVSLRKALAIQKVQPLAAADAIAEPTPVWQAPNVTWATFAAVDLPESSLVIERSEFKSPAIGFELSGAITKVSTDPNFDLTGKVDYDVNSTLKQFMGESNLLQVTDFQVKEFIVKGPLSGAQLANASTNEAEQTPADQPTEDQQLIVKALMSWSGGRVAELPVSAGMAEIAYDGRLATLRTYNVKLSNGQVKLSPSVDLSQPRPAINLNKNIELTGVELNEDFSRTWLRYVSPFFADATSVNGTFSLHDVQGHMPIHDTSQGNVSAKLSFQDGRLGPGPTLNQIFGLVETVRGLSGFRNPIAMLNPQARWVEVPRQTANITMKDGLVEHEQLVYLIAGVPMTTSGSVNVVTQEMNMVAALKIPDDWVEGRPLLAALKGESITIGIGGTTARPQIDGRPIADLARKFGAGAAGNLIFDLIDRRRERRRNR